MKWPELLSLVGNESVFETGLLLSGDRKRNNVHRQLTRWCQQGKLVQVRRGLYAFSPVYRGSSHPFVLANKVQRGSYVSLESALSHYGVIPEAVTAITSISTQKPARYETPLGVFTYRHVQKRLFFGHGRESVGHGQHAYVASKEKALLDLVYLTPHGDQAAYLEGLRLQHLDTFDQALLADLVNRSRSQKLTRALSVIRQLQEMEEEEYHTL